MLSLKNIYEYFEHKTCLHHFCTPFHQSFGTNVQQWKITQLRTGVARTGRGILTAKLSKQKLPPVLTLDQLPMLQQRRIAKGNNDVSQSDEKNLPDAEKEQDKHDQHFGVFTSVICPKI